LARATKSVRDIGGALQEAIALFSKDERRVFLGEQIERDHQLLRQKVMGLTGQLSDLVEIQLLGAEEAFARCGAS